MKVIEYINLADFEFWGGASDRVENLTASDFDTIETALEDIYPEGMDRTQINDIFWFDFDYIAQILGYESEEDFNEQRNA